jgi:predicted transcriptional regulator YheO
MIMDSYKKMMDGLADYLGTGYEIVLHSLEDLEKSVVKIINGEHTGRKEGAPITNFALNILFQLQEGSKYNHLTYFSEGKHGEVLKSCTILIRGENERVIGMLCLNFYLDTPLSTFISAFQGNTPLQAGPGYHAAAPPVKEWYSSDTDDLLLHAVQDAKERVDADPRVNSSLKNREIVRLLNEQGLFNFKNAVIQIAEMLNISKNTVYMHLRALRADSGDGEV